MNRPEPISIALTDDYAPMLAYMKKVCIHGGFRVLIEACDGADLLRQLGSADRLPDVCLLDVQMPVIDGFETAKRLRAHYPSISILGYSSDYEPVVRRKMIECGAHAFIPKGLAPSEYIAAIRQLVN